MDFRIISIGCLAAHPLWNERGAVRTGHATTTLITSGKRRILVDPGLPPQALSARLSERAGISPQDVTDVFLTSFAPDVRRGLARPRVAHAGGAAVDLGGDPEGSAARHGEARAEEGERTSPNQGQRAGGEGQHSSSVPNRATARQRRDRGPDTPGILPLRPARIGWEIP